MLKRPIQIAMWAGVAGRALLAVGLLQGLHGLGHWPSFGGGDGRGDGDKGSAEAAGSGGALAPAKPGPLEITVNNDKYLVKGVEVGSVEELVAMAAAVPAEVPPPRVRVVLRGTSRYVPETKLIEALQAAKIDFLQVEE